jgi:RNA polymerase sigma factor (sigma-70 family)
VSHAELAAGVWRIERSRLLGARAKLLRDLDEAEDCAQDPWPRDGVPPNPAAWLMTATRNKALDRLRHRAMLQREHEALAADDAAAEAHIEPDFVDRLDAARDRAAVGDDQLRLIFIACHPVLPRDAQVALTLRLLGGLETAEIARGFLVSEATVAQRIVRAKKALHGQAFELPRVEERAARLGAVLTVVYLIFNEGHSAGIGAELLRPALCEEALRLARQLAHLLPEEPEAHGLAALLAIPLPVVALNRAVADGYAHGPAAAWPLLQALAAQPQLRHYPFLAGAQADVLERLGRPAEARQADLRAAELTENEAQRGLLQERAACLAG